MSKPETYLAGLAWSDEDEALRSRLSVGASLGAYSKRRFRTPLRRSRRRNIGNLRFVLPQQAISRATLPFGRDLVARTTFAGRVYDLRPLGVGEEDPDLLAHL